MFKLRVQFFIIILLLCAALTAGLETIIKHNFKKDFWHYIEERETRFAAPLIKDLQENFHTQKNWVWISDWHNYISNNLEKNRAIRHPENIAYPPKEEIQESATDDDRHEHPIHPKNPSMAMQEHHDFSPRNEWQERRRLPPPHMLQQIFLLDAQKNLVAGEAKNKAESFLIPLKDDHTLIGFLGIPFNPAVRDLPDTDFAQGLEHKLSLIIIIALIIASLAAFPLAHLLTKRMRLIAEQIALFSQGNYREKIQLKGRDELTDLATHINNLGDVLAQSETTRRQWVADISHELRTPLAVLQAELEAMEDGVRVLDESAIKRLSQHTQRLNHLVKDLYELSLTDLGGMTYRKNTLDLSALLQESLAVMHPQFEAKKIGLEYLGNLSPVNFYGDQQRLQQLFLNILKNSLEYTDAPGNTHITLQLSANEIIIVCEDSAPGVKPEHQAALFDRLYRADSSRNRATGGAGLGLSICKNIVAAHEGTISTASSPLGGLKMSISFPRNPKTL
jgi:two-component system sensor histidine kinase BaeS